MAKGKLWNGTLVLLACAIIAAPFAQAQPGKYCDTAVYSIPTSNSQPRGVTAGPDGALWFTEFRGNNIGRITIGGSFNEYAVPTPNSEPYGITMGPDGELWFTEYSGNKVGRITVAGSIREYPIPTHGSDSQPSRQVRTARCGLSKRRAAATARSGELQRPVTLPNIPCLPLIASRAG
jgi:virginiamycin B lyase